MPKNKSNAKERHNCKMMIKIFIRMMQSFLSLPQPKRVYLGEVEFEDETWEKGMVPQDVKEGHFAVFAVKCEKPKRFVVELECPSNPAFLRLLEQAGEEYGFKQNGAITLPCEPEELLRILQERREKRDNAGHLTTLL